MIRTWIATALIAVVAALALFGLFVAGYALALAAILMGAPR